MEPLEALFIGFLPSYVGIAFRGMELANLAASGANGELAKRAAARIAELRAHNAQTIDHVNRVDAILGKHQLARPAKPRTFDEFTRWAGDASKAAGAAVPQESRAAAALLAGSFFGDLIAAATLGGFVLGFLDAEPAHAGLSTEASRLAKQLAQAANRLETTLRHPALPAKAKTALESALAAVKRTPAIDSRDRSASAQQQLVAELNRRIPEINAAF
jgi:hypothetical protein